MIACQTCGLQFHSPPSRKAKFCSHPCYQSSLRVGKGPKWEARQCAHCGESFDYLPGQGVGKFCSTSCSNDHRRTGSVTDGYRWIWVAGTKIMEHRHVMQEYLGRTLGSDEHVHHINENRSDNRIENLMVMTASEHISHHHKLNRWSQKHDCCQSCGTTDRRHDSHGLCRRCNYKRRTR